MSIEHTARAEFGRNYDLVKTSICIYKVQNGIFSWKVSLHKITLVAMLDEHGGDIAMQLHKVLACHCHLSS